MKESALNLIREEVNNARNDRFSYELETYLKYLDRLTDLFDINILADKELVLEYYEIILELLEGIKDSFNENNIPEELKEKVLTIIIPNWDHLTYDKFLKDKQLDDTLINIISMLHLNNADSVKTFYSLLNKYKAKISDENYNEIRRRI